MAWVVSASVDCRTNQAAIPAGSTLSKPIPISITARTRPATVTGKRSPYPMVLMVLPAHQTASQKT